MKWFKHFSNAHNDNALNKVRMRYGAEGYAIYWYCLELIAGDLEGENASFELSHDAEVIGYNLKVDQLKVQEIMNFMVDLNLFESSNNKITCLKMAKFLEKKSTRNSEIHKIIDSFNEVYSVADMSGVVADKSKHSALEEKRRDKNINTQKKSSDFVLPDWLDQSTWDQFKQMRVKIKKPMTPYAEKLIISSLTKIKESGADPLDSLNNSIKNSWQDVYPPKVQAQEAEKQSWERDWI